MNKRITGFIKKAFAPKPAQAKKPGKEFNLREYMPSFSARDHAIARRNGYSDAQEQWLWENKGRLGTHAEIEGRKRARLETLLAMESEGVPMEELISLSEKARQLPACSGSNELTEVRVPDNSEVRKVKVTGMLNRYIALLEKMDARGLDFEMSEDDVPYEDKRFLRYMKHERDEIARRLEACGECIDSVHEDIRLGAVRRVDHVRVIVPSEDPLIQKIQEEENAQMCESSEEEEDSEKENTLTIVLEESAHIPGKTTGNDTTDNNHEDNESEDTDESNDEDQEEDTAGNEEGWADGGGWDAGWSDPWT
jgi:hypothetical protein